MPMTPGPQPAAITQEQQILFQARANIMLLEPRLRVTTECLQILEDGAVAATPHLNANLKPFSPEGMATLNLVEAMMKVQLIQLRAALAEGQADLEKYKDVVQQIESRVKIFRPAGYNPQGAA